jgi:hypothetical protein
MEAARPRCNSGGGIPSNPGPLLYTTSPCENVWRVPTCVSATAASLALVAPGRFSPAGSSSVKPCFRALPSQ